jgi:hypothetical protein
VAEIAINTWVIMKTTEKEKLMDSVIEIVEVSNVLPLKHQVGKLLFATLVGFAATKLAEKTYIAGLDRIQAMKQIQVGG